MQQQHARRHGGGDSPSSLQPESRPTSEPIEASTIADAFRAFDAEGKGFISHDDLRRVLSGYREEMLYPVSWKAE